MSDKSLRRSWTDTRQDAVADYRNKKRKVEELIKEESRLSGALERLMSQLREDHGCSSLEEADTLITKLRKELKKEEANYARLESEWIAKYSEKLEAGD